MEQRGWPGAGGQSALELRLLQAHFRRRMNRDADRAVVDTIGFR